MDFLDVFIANDVTRAIVAFVVVLGVIVFVHEMGHYLVARFNGVRVDVFSIGFGREIFGWYDASGTRWKVSLLPLGGYVKMFGDADAASTPSGEAREMTPEERRVSFHHKRLGQRTAIVLAGPLANFLLAVVILAGLFATVGQQVTPPELGRVLPGSAAEAAGMRAGDRVLEIEGRGIERFDSLQQLVSESAGVPLRLVVLRDGAEVELVVTPRLVETTDIFGKMHRLGRIGVTRTSDRFVRHDPVAAVWAATEETVWITAETLRRVGQMIIGTRAANELSGPIFIAQVAGKVAETSMVMVIWFMAVLSINLGLINLFPIPLLDGGHLLFYVAEAVRGRPLGERAHRYGFRFGLATVLILMVFVTWNDVVRIFGS